ncbi:MAG TPA: exosome complex RNA-binding protein Csl4 [Nitrososphaerales archaeon]|nr:exosome complex RNA-binding protein Csl4 [Nitrososphaerales archaeon]
MERSNQREKFLKAIPGDRLATIEEFVPGVGSASIGDSVISTVVGDVRPDMVNRVINVKPAKSADDSLPKVGDYVIGHVDSAQPSMVQATIIAVNDEVSDKELSGMLSMRDERRRRTTSPIKAGDTIRAKVISTKNSIYHLAIDDSKSGVIQTVCSNCGGSVIAMGRDRVKCRECGLVDERLLSDDFIKNSRSLSGE